MHILKIALCVLVSVSSGYGVAGDPKEEAQAKIDKFLEEANKIDQEFQVTVRVIKVKHHRDKPDSDPSYTEKIFRKVKSTVKGTPIIRFDICETNPFDPGSMSMLEHNLILPDKVFYSWDTKVGAAVKQFENIREARTDMHYQFTPYLGAVTCSLQLDAAQQEADWRACHVFKTEYLDNRKWRAYLVHESGLSVAVVTFAREPEWLIESTKTYSKKGNPVNYLDIKVEQLSEFAHYTTTRIAWEKSGEDRWVPSRVIRWANHDLFKLDYDRYETDIEVQFNDWRFDKKIQTELLDPDLFKPERIMLNTNFAELEQTFLRAPRPDRAP